MTVENIHLAKLEAQRQQGGEQGRPLQIVTRTGHQVDDIDILPDFSTGGCSWTGSATWTGSS